MASDRLKSMASRALFSVRARWQAVPGGLRFAAAAHLALIPEIHETFVDADRRLRELLTGAIRDAEPPRGVDTSALSSVVLAILRGVAMQWVRDPGELDLDAVKREVRRLLEGAFAPQRGRD